MWVLISQALEIVAVSAALAIVSSQTFAQTFKPPSNEDEVIRGVVKPLAEATLSTEIVARITAIPFRAGMSFNKGDLLIEFDCARERAKLSAADADRVRTNQQYKSNIELAKFNAIGEHDVLLAKADVDRSRAEYRALEATVKQCKLRAPFSGRVIKAHVNSHETPPAGGPLLEIINDNDFELELIVPSIWLSWLTTGVVFEFKVDETAKTHSASVTRIGATVDSVSQTVLISGQFAERPRRVLAGMSGTAHFVQPAQPDAGRVN